ncbi:hypothetical protein PR048_025445 [Dryococelus australis]|uniref:PiggyBac transposable element-derived protein domain-containing protein n=1 Tax=Dryococelus australis TaxID=614101 RepID=A0ABQ9GRB5_9NEOP|nr:hypothetical protein PR048_025445 [Dryococelus australis]
MKGRGKRKIPEKGLRPTASSGTIATCESPVTRPGIEPSSPWWETGGILHVVYKMPKTYSIEEFQSILTIYNPDNLCDDDREIYDLWYDNERDCEDSVEVIEELGDIITKTNGSESESEEEQGRDTGMRAGMDLVEQYFESGRGVTTDNFFTSIPLAEALLCKKLRLDTTIHENEERKPEIIQHYNETKGRVDLGDMMTRKYSCVPMTTRWPLRLFMGVIDITELNAYIMWKENNPDWHKNIPRKRRCFLHELILIKVLLHKLQKWKLEDVLYVPGTKAEKHD